MPAHLTLDPTEASTPTDRGAQTGRRKWAVLIALCAGQFVMVLDSTVMNVSIQRVIEDLAPGGAPK